jgi:hypothetical protein
MFAQSLEKHENLGAETLIYYQEEQEELLSLHDQNKYTKSN